MTAAAAGMIVWLTGLPASGKSTLAERARTALARAGRPCVVLDGDRVRAALGERGYDPGARDAFYRTLAELAAILAEQGVVVLVPATAHRRAHRAAARALAPRFVEVWVRAPVAECERRDVKGLYARARAGDAPTLPGIGVPYEAPEAPDVVADGGLDEQAVARIVALAG